MAKLHPQQRIKDIYQMLFEIATGNLSYRVDETQQRDGLDELITTLNRFPRQLQAAILKHGYVSPRYTYQNLMQLSLIINHDLLIIDCSSDISMIYWQPGQLLDTVITNILTDDSAELFNSTVHDVSFGDLTLHLTFVTPQQTLVPRFTSIAKLSNGNIILNTVTTILQDLLFDLPTLSSIYLEKPRPSEAEVMQQLYDYILQNLDKPLPTLKQLAKLFRINEYDLKHGFRMFFNTSIHRFYNNERLKRAHVMIESTGINLKTIAVANGFSNYTSFYKSFKQHFGYAPSSLQRQQ